MTRALLAIGCNVYENLKQLGGAEKDAQQIFDALIRPELGDYEPTLSRLLLSPTLDEVRYALTQMLFENGHIQTLTITFAGHGAVSAGSFYMAMRDSRVEALSVTAFALADLFRMIAEAAPSQTYVVIDACEAGGLTSDLNVILKSDLIGKLGTPGISLLATSASNESANEDHRGGIGTSAVLDCIRGDVLLQDVSPILDLVEIGRSVSQRVGEQGGQTPVVWGLNLYGPPSFCKNPHAGTGNAPLRSLMAAWPNPQSADVIRSQIQRLWEPYATVSEKWNARDFLNRLSTISANLHDSPSALCMFINRTADDFAAQAVNSRDMFREIEVRATCAVALLPYCHLPEVVAAIEDMASDIATLVESSIDHIAASIEQYEFAMINDGLVDLYRLPIKLSQLLGWAGFAIHASMMGIHQHGNPHGAMRRLLSSIFKSYALSLISMSDKQAPYIAVALTAVAASDLAKDGEQLLGYMFATAVECEGRVADGSLEPARIFEYLIARHHKKLADKIKLTARPSELLTVLLRSATLFGLNHEFNEAMSALDHLGINAYLPINYNSFGDEQISDGVNASFVIGHEIWTVEDLENSWPNFPMPASTAESLASMMSSLLFPDRTPWFLFTNSAPRVAESPTADFSLAPRFQ